MNSWDAQRQSSTAQAGVIDAVYEVGDVSLLWRVLPRLLGLVLVELLIGDVRRVLRGQRRRCRGRAHVRRGWGAARTAAGPCKLQVTSEDKVLYPPFNPISRQSHFRLPSSSLPDDAKSRSKRPRSHPSWRSNQTFEVTC